MIILAVVVAVPLACVGVADMRGVWRSNRAQLDEALRQQAELAAVAFERWTDAQRQPLSTLAAEAGELRSSSFLLRVAERPPLYVFEA